MNSLFNISIILILINFSTSCPPDREKARAIGDSLFKKFTNDICGQGIKPGGLADLNWVNKTLISHYFSRKWLTRNLPRGWAEDRDNILDCHKNDYNYCLENDQKKLSDCFRERSSGLFFKYIFYAISICPILDEKVENYDRDDKPQAMRFFTQYCKTKDKIC